MSTRPRSRKLLLLAVSCFLLFIAILLFFYGTTGLSSEQLVGIYSSFSSESPVQSSTSGQSILTEESTHPSGPVTIDGLSKPSDTFIALLQALNVMQSHFYTIWQGQWPHAIDWTAAVMGTQVSATLAAMTETWKSCTKLHRHDAIQDQERENTINLYFTQITSFYFGENSFGLRTQAYDDMLWVVLGWLEGIKFIYLHSDLHYASTHSGDANTKGSESNSSLWYAHQFIPQFAHRARLFYDLASRGWDTSLCGGGMVWNPHLAPYKNAITNQLYISASISMYLYFPGDNNASPFSFKNPVRPETGMPPAQAHDPQHLENAVEAYQWLKTSGMTNWRGLYIDGFHISGWRGGKNGSIGTGRCDVRDGQVYTYNQGVILSGLRGLWVATGSKMYLEDGHRLIRNVIAATGWNTRGTQWRWQWSGLGRNGVMEEACDSMGTCSQNGHTFKGIFFHHFTLFCKPLPQTGRSEGVFETFAADKDLFTWHHMKCEKYGRWLRHNARAAYMTRDEEGEFGTWWGIPGSKHSEQYDMTKESGFESASHEGTDYRNEGVPVDEIWRRPEDQIWQFQKLDDDRNSIAVEEHSEEKDTSRGTRCDPNDRGRGRTVETQSGGLAILRALWMVIDIEK
ncbi:MAG: hypothetical protein LQ337_007566 [Flavoplaca oasis]|nr:MAG: hypothetical protein LQ337_007566 [Flavoplaca oasis]